MKDVHVPFIASALLGVCLAAFSIPARSADPMSSDPQTRTVGVLEQAVKNDPANPELWTHLGFAYKKIGELDQAQAAFEKAVSINTRSTDALFMLGLIYESKHDTVQADKTWKNYLAVETDPGKRSIAEKHIHHLEQ